MWRHEISLETGWLAYQLIFQNESIQLYDTKRLVKSAFYLAVELGHAVYDCYFLALALQRNAMVVTADRKFYERVIVSDYSHYIVWIEEPPYSNPSV